jgi:phage-related minor tail protein
MTESIVVIRLTRNLRYKLTYVKIFETYLESEPGPEIAELLKALIQAQQSAISPLSRYLRHLDVQTQDLELDQKLMNHALSRDDTRARMRFIYDGLSRAASWYKTQLLDRQMTADREVKQLLIELGEIDAAKVWRTEAVMGMLRIPTKLRERDWTNQQRVQPDQDVDWKPRLVEDTSRPVWEGDRSGRWPRPSKYRRGGSS